MPQAIRSFASQLVATSTSVSAAAHVFRRRSHLIAGAAQRLTGITLRHIRRGRGGAEENKPISVFGSDIVLQALLQLQVATTGRARRTGAAVRRPATGVRGIGDAGAGCGSDGRR